MYNINMPSDGTSSISDTSSISGISSTPDIAPIPDISPIPDITFRTAAPDDAEELLEIYAPYVQNTAVSFEYAVPTVEEFSERITQTLERYPYIVAIADGHICGYAYASPFHSRAAYLWSAQTSIYISRDYHGRGLGRTLYAILEDILKKQNILNLYACVASLPQEAYAGKDEHLSDASLRFHERLGYRAVGIFRKCGYKFGRWYDMVWMEKIIGEHSGSTPPVIAFPDIKI